MDAQPTRLQSKVAFIGTPVLLFAGLSRVGVPGGDGDEQTVANVLAVLHAPVLQTFFA